jgi:phytoene dehydrogenase-like protein
MHNSASVIGSGPNGLSAALVLAQAGLRVEVFEAQSAPGGAVRTMELTLPGFRHDFGSAVFPLGVGSPFFSSLPLEKHGLEWIHPPAPLAHPLDDGTAVVLERDLEQAKRSLGQDGAAWADLLQPFVDQWPELSSEVLGPVPLLPKHPLLMARFGLTAFRSARSIAQRFQNERTRALFGGIAAHSFLSLDESLSGAFGILLAISAHAVGWPIARGGSQSLTDSLCSLLGQLGGKITTSTQVESLRQLPPGDLVLCDVTPRQLLKFADAELRESFKRILRRFRYGPGAFKVDYALNAPIPWRAAECARAATVHLGGTFEEIALSESTVRNGGHADRPFILLVQPSLLDKSRAPSGQHTAWAYCHVPNGSAVDMLPRIEDQIERFAPGFRDCILARNALPPSELEKRDGNLVGGDISGGIADLRQFLFRPSWRGYSTSAPNLYICSASTPPGGGVHGMCGYHAAKSALRKRAR